MNDSLNSLTDATPAEYHSYLLRIWRPSPPAMWRIMVEGIVKGERQSFASLEDLFIFLQAQLHSPPATAHDAANRVPDQSVEVQRPV